jgi:hypothetical protein
MSIPDQRALENERLFRSANERIDERRRELDVDGRTPYLCECEEPTCTELIRLTLEEFRQVSANRGQFLIAPGHPTRGDPVERRNGYLVVRKNEG